MNIITVTLNPAIDVHIFSNRDDMPRAERTVRHSGGKGINVSRALSHFGVDSLCYAIVGRENMDSFLEPLTDVNLVYDVVLGRVRENVHYHLKGGERVAPGAGPCVTKSDIERMRERLLLGINSGTMLVFSGSIPPSSDKDAILNFLLEAKARGARIILDSRSFDLDDIRRIYPYLIKPNKDEFIDLLGVGNEPFDATYLLNSLGSDVSENVILTLGENGAVLYNGREVYLATFPEIEAVSTTGAGDSVIAGFLFGVNNGESLTESFRTGVAFGSASCLTDGTLPPRIEDVNKIRDRVAVNKITCN